MKRNDAQPIGSIIDRFIGENNLGQKLDETRVLKLWGEIAGETVNAYTRSLYIHNRTLHVQLSSSVIRNELTMLRSNLLSRINEQFNQPVIDQIIFR